MDVLLLGDAINGMAMPLNMVDTMRLRQGAFTTPVEKGK
jgi:hypothetical protein